MTAEPVHASRPRPGPNRLASIVDVGRALGFDLMAWQKLVIERATATRDPLRDVIISTPRQVGKSLLMELVIIEKMLSAPDQFVLFGAQSRMVARGKLLDGWWPLLSRSELADRFTISRGAGFEALRCDNGSLLRLLSTEESSGHGDSVDLVVVDECWALDARVEQAVRPATIRRPGAQIWLCSTAGTDKSVWWKSKVDAGREIVAAPPVGGSVGFFEWAAPDGAAITDEATWWKCHPALAEGYVPIELIRADALAMSPSEFARAYCNVWTSDLVDAGWGVIDQDAWARARR